MQSGMKLRTWWSSPNVMRFRGRYELVEVLRRVLVVVDNDEEVKESW